MAAKFQNMVNNQNKLKMNQNKDDKKPASDNRPTLKTTAPSTYNGDDKKKPYKETPKTGPKEARKSASDMAKQKGHNALSEKLGKGMASGIANTMKSTTYARNNNKGK